MKSNMKKIAAILTALLLAVQIVPVFGETYSSGMIVGSSEGFKEALDIVASKGTYVLLGQTLQMDVNEDYNVTWKSGNEKIATIDEDGLITAIAEGTVTITAEADFQKATTEVVVIDPAPLAEQAAEEEAANIVEETPAEEETTEEEGTPAEEQQAAAQEQTPAAPAEKRIMVIVINGENDRLVYNGEEQILDRFVATSNDDGFDPDKVKFTGELGVKAIDCGAYELNLEEVEFSYDDPNVSVHFVVNNSWLRITPAQATVTANEASKAEGEEDPELTATVTGLFGDDTIDYTLTREEGETVGEYLIEVTGEEKQGNYRINYVSGKFFITGEPVVIVETSVPEGQAVYLGTEITMKAIANGFGDVELTYQWQWSTDNENWIDIEGATKKVYKYELTMENAYYFYRVCVNPAE